ncbi:hypothetical protein CEUSTIGMA_g12992.t1 [Chlamydomonas eustigma]|uniref:Ribonuclease n=1 Tax=Chlamydomonas eustigma TaxID=1157962 RepID=A0A250XR82_9CHLO|nr:hypothetical protein CEUSTIGMA_g12992.t1 [Chlamydomonas eustigma]|eukprot:GAX85577.1 hypothetical protein CEUSTIGMA_g12992.t1 [Chlamydomonas eustigma]
MSQFACERGTQLLLKECGSHSWLKEACVLGIDEAGRGPVLGPMVYAAAYAPLSDDLSKKEFNDSKQLTERKRETLFSNIHKDMRMGYVSEILSAQYLSTCMLSRCKVSLNKIAEDSTVKIIQKVLDNGVSVTHVYVDTVGDPDRYQQRLSQRFPSLVFTVCPKADALYPIVSAASIVAKVIRDRSLVETQKMMSLEGELGTGYPHDATTVAWLKKNLHPVLGFPDLVRFSWETCARLLADQKAAAMTFEADSDGQNSELSQQERISFVSSTSPSMAESSGIDMADAGEVTTELTATQYVILAENQRKKKALADTKSQFHKVTDENKSLLKQLEDTQRENYEVTEFLRQELLQKTEKIAEMDAEIKRMAENKEEELRKLEELAAARETKLLTEAATRHRDMQARIDELYATLSAVMEYKNRQVEVEEEILHLKEENQELKERLEQQRVDLERYYLELNTKMRKEYEQRMEELKKSADEEIDERLDASVKRILQQNRRMAEELKIHVQETDVLQHEVRILEEERGRLMREVSLKSELESGYAKRGAKQSMAIKEAQAKIASLDQSMQQLMQEFDKERQAIMKNTQSQISDAQAEAEALRRLVKLKTRELKNVRRLAQEVLLQRSDVETFLLSSLHLVRKEIERGSLRPRSGPSFSKGSDAIDHNEGAGRLDIKELPWDDRERILRLLFAKVNNQQQHKAFSELPNHPLEPQTQGLHTDSGPAALV